MSLLIKGVTRLSQLTIDADKDWQTKGISNIKELALAMARGDILTHDGTKIIRLAAGVSNTFLTSAGPLQIPFWGPGGLYLNRFFPATLSLTDNVRKNTARDHTQSKIVPITSAFVDTTGDLPASFIKLVTSDLSMTDAETKNSARDYTQSEGPAFTRAIDYILQADGAVQDDGGALTDETFAAQDPYQFSRVAASAQDSGNSSGAYSNADAIFEVGNNGGSARNAAAKLVGISIPAGATVTSAILSLVCKTARASQSSVNVTVKGEAAAAPADYGAAEDFTARAYNATTVNSTLPATLNIGDVVNIDITTIVQALVNAYAPYAAGAMAFEVINNASTASRWHEFYSFDADATQCPSIVIKYTKTNDLNLLPAAALANDAYDFGFYLPFDSLILNVSTAGVGVWTITWKYWNGAWTNLAGVTDPTNGFHNAGVSEVLFTKPGDWALTNISGKNLYWIRAEVTAFTSEVTQPLGATANVRFTI